MMEERFIRSLGPLTEEELAVLCGKKVFIAGCGGLGGYLVEYLLRLGVGEIIAADGDCFELSNMNRQILCTEESLGLNKAEAAAERAACIAPGTVFHAYPHMLTEENLPDLIRGCDAVLDGLDSASGRRLLKAACDLERLPYIFGGVSGWTAQAALSLPGDGLVELLFPAGQETMPNNVLSFVPPLCASLEVSLCVRYLVRKPAEAGVLYGCDLSDLSFYSVKLC